MFNFVEESLDEIAFPVEREVGRSRIDPIRFWGNDRDNIAVLEGFDQRVCIISLVGEKSLRIDFLEQGFGLAKVARLPRRERKFDRVAERIDDGVDFGRQSASGSANGLADAVFFRAPALC